MRKFIVMTLALPVLAAALTLASCDDVKDSFDGGPSDEPNFTAEGTGENTVTDLFIEVHAQRENRNTAGDGTVIINGDQYDMEVIDGGLPTDLNGEPPIPQTDDLLPIDFVCTPRFADLTVRLTPGDFVTTLTLNECEENNPDIFEDDGVVHNPCNGDAPVQDLEFFSGVCLDMPDIGVERGRDTMVLGEFNGLCGNDAPCIVPRDVIVFVPSFNDSNTDIGDIVDEF
ncbi:MAG TPA: hypothetical protein VHC46_00010 [Thermodesulfobacteriota bacterium]|nr:hypothetical protein [Thermodesulfobacteriota bacterium]